MEDELDQEQSARHQTPRAAIREDLTIGLGDRTVPQIMEEVEARLRDAGANQS